MIKSSHRPTSLFAALMTPGGALAVLLWPGCGSTPTVNKEQRPSVRRAQVTPNTPKPRVSGPLAPAVCPILPSKTTALAWPKCQVFGPITDWEGLCPTAKPCMRPCRWSSSSHQGSIAFEYDGAGHLVRRISRDSLGRVTLLTTVRYKGGRMVGLTQSDYEPPAVKTDAKAGAKAKTKTQAKAKADAKAKANSPKPPNQSFFRYSLHYRYQYREGRLVSGQEDGPKNVRHPDKGRNINQKSWHYDKNGRISEYRYRYFRTRYQFDGAGRLLSQLTRPGDNSLRFVHDQAGRVIEARDRAWVYRFVWNAAGRLAGKTSEYVDGGGYSRYSYHYDSAGRLVERRRYGQKSTQPESTERYEYCDAK